MNLGARGIALIKGKEVLRLVAYKPTPHDVWTIGWGSTRGVYEGMTITTTEAELRFMDDCRESIIAVNALQVKLSQSMFDALVSLVFNAGPNAIRADSTIGIALRGTVPGYFKAWRGFALWTQQAGHDLRGLALRRAAEMALFMSDPLPAP